MRRPMSDLAPSKRDYSPPLALPLITSKRSSYYVKGFAEKDNHNRVLRFLTRLARVFHFHTGAIVLWAISIRGRRPEF
jgi:hypothetical protein